MNKAKQRQLVLKLMRQIFYRELTNRYDWMGYLITEDNKPSYHHIVKREELIKKGEDIAATVENGAYLGKKSHEFLHKIEQFDYDLYVCWNDLFLMINNQKEYPHEHLWKVINYLKEESEKRYNEYLSNKRLIK